MRKKTRKVRIGKTYIGGDSPILIQSMTNTKTSDFEATLAQIKALEASGCDIVRFSVASHEDVKTIYKIKCETDIPIVADIHFNYRLAVEAAEAGIDKIRINPGNIGDEERVAAVCKVCKAKSIPIRIGVNSGSLEKEVLAKYGAPTPEALAESAFFNVLLLEKYDFNDIVISVKSSDLSSMISANRIISSKTDIPLHLGVTEAGTEEMGLIKSAIGIGSLLCDGIGDTIRVSLTADVRKEVEAAKNLLSACGLRNTVNVISCPTCGRTQVDLIVLADSLNREIKKRFPNPKRSLNVAVMGCVVNGPGEAREADIGIAGGVGEFLLFKKGVSMGKVSQDNAIPVLLSEIEKILY